jgi:hypothetical protein
MIVADISNQSGKFAAVEISVINCQYGSARALPQCGFDL